MATKAYIPDLGVYNNYRSKPGKAERGETSDQEVVLAIAENIKHHVGMQSNILCYILYSPLLEKQLNNPKEQKKEMEYYPPNKPASSWKIDTVYALRILFHP
jgi:hypothetical protein